MKFVFSPQYECDIGPHVFPTAKYRLVREKLLADGIARPDDFVAPPFPSDEDVLLVHTREMLDDLKNLRWSRRTMSSELPLSREIVDAYLLAAGGSVLATRIAVAGKTICSHLGGGFHHAFPDHAEGFCYVNDIAIAIRVAQRDGLIRRAMVLDCDLHQGNGTAGIFALDPDVFTISIHQENNYPTKQHSNIDVGLDDFASDREYLQALEKFYPPALREHSPELLIYVAGADPYEHDQLGGLKLTKDGLRARDEFAIGEAVRAGIPVVVVLAGGYAQEVNDTVEIHAETFRIAAHFAVRGRGPASP